MTSRLDSPACFSTFNMASQERGEGVRARGNCLLKILLRCYDITHTDRGQSGRKAQSANAQPKQAVSITQSHLVPESSAESSYPRLAFSSIQPHLEHTSTSTFGALKSGRTITAQQSWPSIDTVLAPESNLQSIPAGLLAFFFRKGSGWRR